MAQKSERGSDTYFINWVLTKGETPEAIISVREGMKNEILQIARDRNYRPISLLNFYNNC